MSSILSRLIIYIVDIDWTFFILSFFQTTSNDHPIVDACGHWLVKSIIKQDKDRLTQGKRKDT